MKTQQDAQARFRTAYAAHRAHEGRGELDARTLPYVEAGAHAHAWRVRARTYERFLAVTVARHAAEVGRALHIVDIGAGNGWLCYRLQRLGHDTLALDLRDDAVDGLRAMADAPFQRVAASFQDLPLRAQSFDIAVFNASLHYATSLEDAFAEAAAVVRPGGRIAILDSPFYDSEVAGTAMVVDKHAHAAEQFGSRADDLLSLPFIEFLTRTRLEQASAALGLDWSRVRVRYPLRYELRPLLALIRARRAPSRFDLWEATVR